MACIKEIISRLNLDFDIMLERVSFKEAREFIEKNSDEVHYVEPGYKVLGEFDIIGVPPLALGVKGEELLFAILKDHGAFVLKIKSEEEIKKLRDRERERVRASLKKGLKPEVQSFEKPVDYRSIFK
ncbi:MAG: DUF1894 domain-containing protein [Methanotrichaceae archaeon]